MGIRQEIANAKTESEVLKLLDRANKNYLSASEKTKRAWKSTAFRTIASFNKTIKNVDTKVNNKKQTSKKNTSKKENK